MSIRGPKGLFSRSTRERECCSSSSSESGTTRLKEFALARGRRDGGASLRIVVCVSFSYSTEVLRGTPVRVDPEAQESFGSILVLLLSSTVVEVEAA